MGQNVPVVAVLKASYRDVEEKIREGMRLLGYKPVRDKILIKPNVVSNPRLLRGIPRAVATDMRFVEALLRIFDGHEITIAEGPGVENPDEVLEKIGLRALAEKYGARLVNLHHAERVEVPWKYGRLRLPALLQTHEYINVPKLKTHFQTGITVACKNQKGLLLRGDQVRFHRDIGLFDAIRALTDAVQPALTVVDGIVGMEGAGPINGRPRRANAIVIGRDMRAVDLVCCDLIAMPPENVPYLESISYKVVGEAVEKLRVQFAPPPSVLRFAASYFHASASTCTRCATSMDAGISAAMRSPRHAIGFLRRFIFSRADVIMGRWDEIPPAARGHQPICYGNCARGLAEKYGLPWIPGCPPSLEENLKMYE